MRAAAGAVAELTRRVRDRGVRRALAAAIRRARREGAGAVRRRHVRLRPPRADAGELGRALAVAPGEALARLGPALPDVMRFRRGCAALTGEEREELLRRADAVRAHRFDLLGSGPVDLGSEIDWLRDFKSGRRWPAHHISRIRLSSGDGSDIKVPWELSRFQHAPLLAGAALASGDGGYLRECGDQIASWLRQNPVEHGPNWACTMDVAIRAANWVAALAVAQEDVLEEPWLDDVLASLLLHGRFIRSHLEDGSVRANHYLSNVVGLLHVGALFAAGAEGRRWVDWAVGELAKEMEHQVREDGCAHEASISYHRLVAELFVCGTHVADALRPGGLPPSYRRRLERMLEFVRDYTRPDGRAPTVGDSDDGRFLPLADYGADPRRHDHLFRQAGTEPEPAPDAAAYPAGGFYVLRGGGSYVIVRCGDTGVGGAGWHAHNDQLAFELSWDGEPLVIDPGTYVYTPDLAARAAFRSTAWHSTLALDGAEQNALRADRPFELPDRTRARAVAWEPAGDTAVFAGRHRGYEALPAPAVHTRRVELDRRTGALTLEDRVESAAPHELLWTFPLAPGSATVEQGRVVVTIGHVALELSADGIEWSVEDGWWSPRYGVREPAPFVRARRQSRPGADAQHFLLRPRPA